MLKTELVAKVANAADLTPRQANECVDSFVEQVTNALARGEQVALVGFGRFAIKHVAARQGRNPQTGQPLTIAARNSPTFKPGSQFKSAVAEGHNDV
ncbi:MAG TPA: HU family DNA-binding protein [Marinagarivorans sp.]